MSKKEWLVYGALITGLLLFYWQVVPDTRVLRTIVGVCVYVLSQLGIGVLRVSQSFKKSFMAILLSILLIWILDASLSTALCVFALVESVCSQKGEIPVLKLTTTVGCDKLLSFDHIHDS